MKLWLEQFCRDALTMAAVVLLLLVMPAVVGGAIEEPVRMYASDTNASLFIVDFLTREAEWVGRTGQAFTDIAFNADGELYGINFFDLYKIDPQTAATSWIGTIGMPNGNWNSLVFDEGGTLWAAGSNAVITIDTDTGVGTPFTTLAEGAAGDLAFDKDGNMYLTTSGGALVRIDTEDGSVTEIGELPYTDIYGFGRGPDDRMYGIRRNNQLLSIDLMTGAAEVLGGLSANFAIGATNGGSFPTEAIPEPATALLLSVVALMAFQRRKRLARTRTSHKSGKRDHTDRAQDQPR